MLANFIDTFRRVNKYQAQLEPQKAALMTRAFVLHSLKTTSLILYTTFGGAYWAKAEASLEEDSLGDTERDKWV